MGREVTIFRSKERKPRGEISRFLREIADRLESGRVVLKQGAEETVLELSDSMVLEIKVEDEHKRNKGVQHSLEIELKWFDGDQGPSGVELG